MQGGQDPDNRRGMYWDEEYQNQEMYVWYQRLISLRKEYRCICEGRAEQFKVNDDMRTLELTRALDDEKVTMVFNCSREKREFQHYQGMKNLITGGLFDGKLNPYEVTVLA